MIVTIGGIPVYDAVISDDETGMFKISLVDDPAVMSNFQAFDATRKMQLYAIQDEEKRLVRGCIMRADFPIYRRDAGFGEYYIIYKAEEIRKMAEKYLAESRQNDVNAMHQGEDLPDIYMVQYFIKGDGIQVDGFDECADGSLFGEFHVVNDEVWEEIKAGTYKGFSLEGVFDLVPEQDKDEIQEIVDILDGAFRNFHKSNDMSKLSRLKEILAAKLQEEKFGNVTTDKGVLSWDGDEDLKEGDSVYVEDSEGNRTPAADGDYKTNDNKVVVVVDGKVSEIKDAEAEVAPAEGEESEFIETDKGKLEWDNEEEDLKEGDAVYVRDEEGNRVPAPDGDYTTEDGKVIKVSDGKVTEIVDPKAEVSEEEVKAKRISKFTKIKEAFEESFDTKMREISNAIAAVINTENFYLVDAGEDFGVVSTWNEETYEEHFIRYSITWNEDGTANAADPQEVKLMFVPMDMESPFAKGNEEEMAALKAENASLKAEVAKLKKTPAAKPAHDVVKEEEKMSKTGYKGLDRLSRIMSAK